MSAPANHVRYQRSGIGKVGLLLTGGERRILRADPGEAGSGTPDCRHGFGKRTSIMSTATAQKTATTGEPRHVAAVIRGIPTSDGDGVKLTRVIGQRALPDLDPFLMLDEFGSEKGADYIGGFPDHPHRGFETVTYMLAGRMRHGDNQGNVGLLRPGSVQWMTAGRGIIHSEMPEQEEGLMWGFQLWVNLPRTDKMTAPR